jgi:NAD(P)-dependent dehydrogenase (short-subunit alcohol dehydrogenase family)
MVVRRDAVSLDGRVAVVTGGGAGIGRAIAAALAEFGARVAVWEKDEASARSAADEIGGLPCVSDVRDVDRSTPPSRLLSRSSVHRSFW